MSPYLVAAASAGLLATSAVGGLEGLVAQTVLGTAVDDVAGGPVAGAFVLLLDEARAERDRGLTTASGTFRLGSARPGTFRLRLERIGFEDLESEPFTLARGETISRRLPVSARPVELSGIEVTGGEPRCGMVPEEAMELARAWDEARKALEATAWTDRQSYYRFDVLLVRQELDERGDPVARRNTSRSGSADGTPSGPYSPSTWSWEVGCSARVHGGSSSSRPTPR